MCNASLLNERFPVNLLKTDRRVLVLVHQLRDLLSDVPVLWGSGGGVLCRVHLLLMDMLLAQTKAVRVI